MANKSDFTVEQWDLLREVPYYAGLMVVAASPSGPIGVYKESSAIGEMIQDSAKSAESELMRALAADWTDAVRVPKVTVTTPDEARSKALQNLREASQLLSQKATEAEAEEMKTWLKSLAKRVSEAAKEGGFLGIGGVVVSPEEAAALDQIEVALR
jgi:hypothetical protein